jgi:hypothetical protein
MVGRAPVRTAGVAKARETGVTGLERDGGEGGIAAVVEDDSKWPRRGGGRCDGRE